jgi:hypothetical protein
MNSPSITTSSRPINVQFGAHAGHGDVCVLCTAEGVARFATLLRTVPVAGSLRLEDVPDVAFDGLMSFTLSTEFRPFLRRRRGDTAVFEWGGDAKAWESRAQLLDGLKEPGHFQYLDSETVGDAEIAVEVMSP